MSYYAKDGLGSTRALTNANGVVTDRYVYDAFGQMIAQTGSTVNSYLFAGQQRDAATGLDYLRARYLNVGSDRFVSRDTFAGLSQDPLSLHRFLYADGNAVNLVDPSGHETLDDISAAEGIQDTLITNAWSAFSRFAVKNIADSLDLLIFATKGALAVADALFDPFGILGGSVMDPSSTSRLQSSFAAEVVVRDKKLTAKETFLAGLPKRATVEIGLKIQVSQQVY
jgi:RHS repeat-associated protein